MENSIHCTLTDAQLLARAYEWLDELIESGGKSWTMQVPARPNKDTDLIFAETINRFKAMVKERATLRARCERMERALKAAKDALLVSEDNGDDFTSAFNKFTSAYKLIDEALSGEPEPEPQPTGNITLQETPSDMQDVDYPKLTPEQIQERKEAIEWIRNPGGMRWVTGEYDRLYEQLKTQPERKIPCFVDYKYRMKGEKEKTLRDICTIMGKVMGFNARGIGYGGAEIWIGEENEKSEFLKECERLNVEWLDEGKEVENV